MAQGPLRREVHGTHPPISEYLKHKSQTVDKKRSYIYLSGEREYLFTILCLRNPGSNEHQPVKQNMPATGRNYEVPVWSSSAKTETIKINVRPKRRILNVESKGICRMLTARIIEGRLKKENIGKWDFSLYGGRSVSTK